MDNRIRRRLRGLLAVLLAALAAAGATGLSEEAPSPQESAMTALEAVRRMPRLCLDDARAAMAQAEDGEAGAFAQMLEQLAACRGDYTCPSASNPGKVYTTGLDFYLVYGAPWCSVTSTAFMGTIDDAPVLATGDGDSPFRAESSGQTVGGGAQQFTVDIAPSAVRLRWADDIDYRFERQDADAIPESAEAMFMKDSAMETVRALVAATAGDQQVHYAYDDSTRLLRVYVEIPGIREKLIRYGAASEDLRRAWNGAVSMLVELYGKLDTVLQISTKDLHRFPYLTASCELCAVDAVTDDDVYYPDDILLILSDGMTRYDILTEIMRYS